MLLTLRRRFGTEKSRCKIFLNRSKRLVATGVAHSPNWEVFRSPQVRVYRCIRVIQLFYIFRKRVYQPQPPSRSPTKMRCIAAPSSSWGCCPACWRWSATSWSCCWRTCSMAASSPNSCWNSSTNSYRSLSTMAEQLIVLPRAHQLIQTIDQSSSAEKPFHCCK